MDWGSKEQQGLIVGGKMFKRIIFTAWIFLIIVVSGWGQVPRKLVEVSLAGSFQVFSENGEAATFINIPLRAGFFATKNLEIEAEFALTAPENSDVGFILSGLLSYNFKTPGGLMPFVTAGYGVTNSIPVITNNVVNSIPDATLGVLNLGGGLKVPLGPRVAFKSEYRFQNFTGGQGQGPSRPKIDFQVHSIFTGFSVFFP